MLVDPPATLAGSTPRSSEAEYWTAADAIMRGVDDQWNAARGAYVVNGNESTRENSMLLLTHAVAALRGHVGPTRHDERARVLVDRLTRAPAWLGAQGPGPRP